MSNEKAKRICLSFLRKKHAKHASMKTPYWEQTVARPIPNAILPYEIYKNPRNPAERETIRCLNELVAEAKADCMVKGGWVWYYAKP